MRAVTDADAHRQIQAGRQAGGQAPTHARAHTGMYTSLPFASARSRGSEPRFETQTGTLSISRPTATVFGLVTNDVLTLPNYRNAGRSFIARSCMFWRGI